MTGSAEYVFAENSFRDDKLMWYVTHNSRQESRSNAIVLVIKMFDTCKELEWRFMGCLNGPVRFVMLLLLMSSLWLYVIPSLLVIN